MLDSSTFSPPTGTSLTQLQALFEELPCFVWLFDPAVGLLWTNRAGRRFLHGEDNIRPASDSAFAYAQCMHPEDMDAAHAAMARMMAEPEANHGHRYRMRGPDGQFHWLEFHLYPVTDIAGVSSSWIGISQPVLATAVASDDTVSDPGLSDLLERSLDRLDQLAMAPHVIPALAHDLNNRLQTVLLGLESALMLHPHPILQSRLEPLAQSLHQAGELGRRMASVVCPATDAPSVLEPDTFFATHCDLLHQAAGKRKPFEMTTTPGLPAVRLGPDRLLRLLVPVVAATRRRAGDQHTVCINVQQQQQDNHDQLLITLHATGDHDTQAATRPQPGADPDDGEDVLDWQLLERFVQTASGTLSRGTTHQGFPCLTLAFPVCKDVDAGSTTAPAPSQRRWSPAELQPGKVLVLETDPVLRRTLHQCFENLGWTALTAFSINHVLQLLAEGLQVDLVLADPHPADPSLITHLVRPQADRPAPLIILTAEPAGGLPSSGHSGNARMAVLDKPFSLQELQQLIARLQRRQGHSRSTT